MAERLKGAASAYLRSAVEQPVDWYPWGPEPFARARAEDKPILLDIGGAWCHWCHVIDHESYEDPATAEIINKHFVAIKVDRDERPDVDARYQHAVQVLAGQGGWPLTAFLTPDGRAFFGGTYFPPTDSYGRPSFKRVLLSVAQYYRDNRDEIATVTTDLEQRLARVMAGTAPGDLDPALVERAVRDIAAAHDAANGGFGGAPKFPHTGTMELLIRRAYPRRDDLLGIITRTLERMARGGIYDQVGGGFHRYSTDARWVVPHFEKMLYDNAGLLSNYVHGYQLTGRNLFREIAFGTYAYLRDTLSDRDRGGFYASQDADIGPHDDGDYYTWTVDEARAVLTEDEFRVAVLRYDIGERGEMHHDPRRNALFLDKDPDAVALLTGLPEEQVHALLRSAQERLRAARVARPTPFIDRTIYAAWNGMAISACLDVSTGLNLPEARTLALRALDRILATAYRPGQGIYHLVDEHAPAHAGLLDDQVFVAQACLDAFAVTAEPRYLDAARDLADYLQREFEDPNGGFVDIARHVAADPALATPHKPVQDSPTPGANAVAVLVLNRLARLLSIPVYRAAAERTLGAFAGTVARFGLYASTYFLALDDFLREPAHVVVVAREPDGLAGRLHQTALATFRPGKIVALYRFDGSSHPDRTPPLPDPVRAMAAAAHRTQAFVCAGNACAPPTTDPEELADLIRTFQTG